MNPIAVVTTVDDEATAREIARAIIERRLAACAQISTIESCYLWEGALQQEREYRILFKAPRAGYQALERALLGLHPYELPAIHAFDCSEAYGPYADWVEASATAG